LLTLFLSTGSVLVAALIPLVALMRRSPKAPANSDTAMH